MMNATFEIKFTKIVYKLLYKERSSYNK